MHNIRVLRNVCVNVASNALSTQTLYGGPAYFIRNIVYNAPNITKHAANPSGAIYYHNTFVAETAAAQSSNYHFRNNLFLGRHSGKPIFSINTFTAYTSSDFNGFRPNPETESSFIWTGPRDGLLVEYAGPRQTLRFATLAEYSKVTGQDSHSVLIDYDVFVNVAQPDPDEVTRIYKFEDLDFRLRPNCKAIDAGVIIPNVNDHFTGKAPDLGALEAKQPVPIYGPRP